MTWSYTDPSASAKDAVRFAVGDTDTSDQQLSDEEIASLLVTYPSPLTAAINACARLSAKYARQVTKTVGRLSIAASDRAKAYRELAADLKEQRRANGLTMFAGGRTIAGNQEFNQDTGATQPSFAIGQDDFPDAKSTARPPYPWESDR